MFKPKHSLRSAEAGQEGAGGASQHNPTATVSPAAGAPAAGTVDVQAQINTALTQQQADFNAKFKEATGHSDLKAFTEAQLIQQGKLQELADTHKAGEQKYKGLYEKEVISNALLTAAPESVAPVIVKDLLVSRGQVDDNGNVTIDGKSVADAVKKLLDDNPCLAKAQGGTGSGAPQNAGPSAKNPWTKEHWNLTEQVNLNKENPALAAQFKAAAGH